MMVPSLTLRAAQAALASSETRMKQLEQDLELQIKLRSRRRRLGFRCDVGGNRDVAEKRWKDAESLIDLLRRGEMR
eukprot:516457-Hanusia_phi.AAC.1